MGLGGGGVAGTEPWGSRPGIPEGGKANAVEPPVPGEEAAASEGRGAGHCLALAGSQGGRRGSGHCVCAWACVPISHSAGDPPVGMWVLLSRGGQARKLCGWQCLGSVAL